MFLCSLFTTFFPLFSLCKGLPFFFLFKFLSFSLCISIDIHLLCHLFNALVDGVDFLGLRVHCRCSGQACHGADGWQLSGIVPDDGTLL